MSAGPACQDDLCRMMSVSGGGGGAGGACRGWGDTYQILLTQLPELLELLGHQQLGTPHCTADLPQDCRKDTDAHACTHTHTTHNSQCNYSQNRILQACCSANREAAFVMQQKRDALDSSFISASKKHQTFGEDRFILKCAEILNLKKCSPKIETLYKLPARNKWFSCLSKWKPLQSSTCSWGNKLFCVSHNACLAEWYTR